MRFVATKTDTGAAAIDVQTHKKIICLNGNWAGQSHVPYK